MNVLLMGRRGRRPLQFDIQLRLYTGDNKDSQKCSYAGRRGRRPLQLVKHLCLEREHNVYIPVFRRNKGLYFKI